MSRLADAQARLEAALQQLESALASHPGAGAAADPSAGAVDRAAIIAEIDRIDEQLSSAMQLIDRARHAPGGEGGTA